MKSTSEYQREIEYLSIDGDEGSGVVTEADRSVESCFLAAHTVSSLEPFSDWSTDYGPIPTPSWALSSGCTGTISPQGWGS